MREDHHLVHKMCLQPKATKARAKGIKAHALLDRTHDRIIVGNRGNSRVILTAHQHHQENGSGDSTLFSDIIISTTVCSFLLSLGVTQAGGVSVQESVLLNLRSLLP